MLLLTLSLFAGASKESKETRVEITIWSFPIFGNDGSTEEVLIKAFEEAHPDIKVNLELIDFVSGPAKIIAAIEGGSTPDIVFDAPGRIVDWGKNGVLVPLDELFTEEFINDVNNNNLISSCTDGKHYWMYPLSSAPFWMSINKEMWEESGAFEYVNTEGDRLWTTDDFVNAMLKLRDSGEVGLNIYCGGSGGDQGTRALIYNLYSSFIVDENGNWSANNKGIRDALGLLINLQKEGAIDFGRGIQAADEILLYKNGHLASSICWGTSSAKINNTDQFTEYSVPFPSDDGVPELEYLVNGFCVFDNGSEEKRDASIEFIKFVCDDPTWGPYAVKASAAFPVRTSFENPYIGDKEYELLSSWTKYYAPYYNTNDNFANMRKEWWNMLQYISTGDKSIEEALRDFDLNSNK